MLIKIFEHLPVTTGTTNRGGLSKAGVSSEDLSRTVDGDTDDSPGERKRNLLSLSE